MTITTNKKAAAPHLLDLIGEEAIQNLPEITINLLINLISSHEKKQNTTSLQLEDLSRKEKGGLGIIPEIVDPSRLEFEIF